MISRSRFYFLLFLILPALFFMLQPIILEDLSVWVALGRDTLLQKHFIKTDTYTFTAGQDMVYPWLSCFLYGVLYQIAGLKLVALIHKLIPSLWFYLWYRFIRRQLPERFQFWSMELILIFFIGLVGSTLIFIERPALLATALLLLGYSWIQENEDKPVSSVFFAQLMVLQIVWVNIHGSFLLLPVMYFWSLSSQISKRPFSGLGQKLLVGLALLVSCLLNPFGWKIIPYLIQTTQLSKARHLLEWAPPHQWTHPFATVYFYGLSLALIVYLIRHPRVQWKNVLCDPLIPLWISGFFMLRNTFILPLFLPIFLAPYLPLRPTSKEPAQKTYAVVLNLLILASLTAITIMLNPFLKPRVQRFLPEQFAPLYNPESEVPPEIVTALHEHQGRLFNDWNYGSDLALKQDNKDFIDIRNIIFSNEVVDDYYHIANPDAGSEKLLEKYKIDLALIDGLRHPGAVQWFASQDNFRQIAQQGAVVLFERVAKTTRH